MSLIGQDPFYYTSLLNEEQISSSAITYTGLTTDGVVGYDGQTLTSNITTDGLAEGFNQLYFTTARSRAAISGSTGINYDGLTGIITNSGIQTLTGGTGITVSSGSNPTIASTGVLSLSGTANQVTVSSSTGSITINLPQDIETFSSPTFAGLTISSLSGILKAGAGVLSGSATTSDLPEGANWYYTTARSRAAISGGSGISYNSSTGVIDALGSGVTSITGTANQIIVSGSTAVTLSTPQDIGTGSSVQFARLLNSSILSTNLLLGTSTGSNLTTGGGNIFIGQGSGNCVTSGTQNIGIGLSTYGGGGTMTQISAQNIAIGNNALFSATSTANNNVACGYQALQTLTVGNNNSAFGYQAGQAVVGGIRNTLVGNSAGYSISSGSYNTLVGASSSFILTTGSFNTGLGYLAGQSLITGSYNLHLGYNTQASSSSVSNEMVIASNSTVTQGRGSNTCFINAPSGLYSYSPAYCTLVSTAFNNGTVTWAFYSDGTTTYNQGFTLYNSNTLIVQPFAGLYEFTITANMLNTTNYCQVSYVVTNVATSNLAFNSPAVASFLGCVTGCTQYRPFVSGTPTSTGIGVYLNGGNHYGPYPARMTIRFVGL